ncbi:MAG: LysR family transcriptional regulator [Magnetovibrio sp.]|nr:LysR family transcriptional regulator [Magnetovibrio sp.]
MRTLPPLNALRAFESAARHLSMSRAADELHVTPAAISHQVKGLEEFLGMQLFHRQQRGLALTETGAAYLPGLREGFEKIQAATQALYDSEATGPLTVSVTPTFAAKWLVHRLEKFTNLHPEIQVMLVATSLKVRFDMGEADVAVRYGPGNYVGCRVDKMFEEEVYAVCAPELMSGKNPIREPRDLLNHTLLHPVQQDLDDSFPTWEMWLRGHGVRTEGPIPGPNISPHWMLVEAAVNGQGVALVKASVAERDLETGRLVRPFAETIPVAHAYWLISPEDTADKPKVKAFREWIMAEAREHAEHHAELEAKQQAEWAATRKLQKAAGNV